MLRYLCRVAFSLAFFGLVGFASAQSPATRPAAVAVTPMDFMVNYDQLAGQEPSAYLSQYSLNDQEDIQHLAHVQAKFDAQVGMLQMIVQQKWGEDAVNQMLHALGLKSLRDIRSGTIKESGTHASVVFSDGTPGPDLIKTKDGWKLDVPAFYNSLGIPVDDYLKQIRQLSLILPDVADGIVNQKLKDPSAVVSDIAKRINKNDQ